MRMLLGCQFQWYLTRITWHLRLTLLCFSTAVNKVRCYRCPPRSNLLSNFCESDFAIEGSLEEIKSTYGDGGINTSVLMVKVMGVFKGTDAIQNKIIKIDFAANLKSCFCRELQLKKVLVIAGSTTSGGEYFLKEKSSFVRHSGKRLLEKVRQHTKRNKCSKWAIGSS